MTSEQNKFEPKQVSPGEGFTSQEEEALKLLPEGCSIVDVFRTPDKQNLCGASYKEPEYMGRELRKGDTLFYQLPEEMNGRVLDSITFAHRKDRQYCGSVRRNVRDSNGVLRKISDTQGAYTRLLAFDAMTKQWVAWHDPYKSPSDLHFGAKYAEKRSPADPENETLYDWLKQGKIKPRYIAMTAIGDGPLAVTNYHGLHVDYFPEGGSDITHQELIFSAGTEFVGEKKNVLAPQYGGGEHHGNSYPNSILLNSYSSESLPYPTQTQGDGFSLDSSGRLHIRVNAKFDFSRLEVAAGDTHPDGTLGWAKLNAYLVTRGKNDNETTEPLFENANVPPNGVIKGSPTEKRRLKPGDEVIISSSSDTAFVMGVRLQ